MADHYDFAVIGGEHNGLSAARTLAGYFHAGAGSHPGRLAAQTALSDR